MYFDDEGFVEFDADMISVDPLGISRICNKAGATEAEIGSAGSCYYRRRND